MNRCSRLSDEWANFSEEVDKKLLSYFNNKKLENMSKFIPANVYEDDDKYTVSLLTPGVKREDLEIEVNDNEIYVKATRKNNDVSGKLIFNEMRRENLELTFSFKFNTNVDNKNTVATYLDGELLVVVPKLMKKEKSQYKVTIT